MIMKNVTAANAPLQLRRDSTSDVDERDISLAILDQSSQVPKHLFREFTGRHEDQRPSALSPRIVLVLREG
jgi:hypothetical protein